MLAIAVSAAPLGRTADWLSWRFVACDAADTAAVWVDPLHGGRGTYSWANGDVYVGGFRRSEFHGFRGDFNGRQYARFNQQRFNPAQPATVIGIGQIANRVDSFDGMTKTVGVGPGTSTSSDASHSKDSSFPT